MDAGEARALFQSYVEGWVHADPDEILGVLDPGCLVVESHGPTYRGRRTVERWVDEWFGAGGVVESWDVTSFHLDGAAAFVEWDFICVFAGERSRFAGATSLRFADGHISEIREYRMTSSPFDWAPDEAGGEC